MGKDKAILAINPDARFNSIKESGKEEVITWFDGTTPISDADILAKQKELQIEYDAKEYQRLRKRKYPKIEDVTVALAEKAEGDSTMWDEISAKRAEVKEAHPKP